MNITLQIITNGLCVLGTMTTRFLPFLVFRENRETPKFIQYVGKFLPSAVFEYHITIQEEDFNLGILKMKTPEGEFVADFDA